jgi:hypothetical protein
MAQNTNDSGLVWRKSTSSEAGSCVEVAQADEVVLVRDSKNPEKAILQISRPSWSIFLQTIKDGAMTEPPR